MKKLIVACAVSAIYMTSFAQTDTTHKQKDYDLGNKKENMQKDNSDKQNQKNNNMNKDCAYIMENGKVMKIVNGKKEVMDKEMTLKNGSVIMQDGSMKMNDGKTMKMKEGECLDMSGKHIEGNKPQQKKDSKMNE